jgi:hypothetical protein
MQTVENINSQESLMELACEAAYKVKFEALSLHDFRIYIRKKCFVSKLQQQCFSPMSLLLRY